MLTKFVAILMLMTSTSLMASGGSGEEYNAGETIMHHISDSHEWHFIDYTGEDGEMHSVSIPLPVILWHQGQGLKIFSSSKFHHGTEAYDGYIDDHGEIKYVGSGSIENATTDGVIDLSITKNVVTIFLVSILVLWMFISIARSYARKPNSAPKGLASFFEPLIIFIRDDIALAVIGEKHYKKFMPFLLSVFFFIWIANMLGLVPFIPGGANMTGNIAVTLVLAAITFVIIMVNSNKHYWQHVLAMPGVPGWLLVILTPIELLGVFLKPAILCLRLFANIMAGHITILAFMSLIFIMGKMGAEPVIGYGTGVVAVLLSIIVSILELLVAFLQAFIFTLLTATYFASATEEAHH
jgi:F-type H+-transporting ATPase subunit a